jgi:hypothetical protein
MVDIADLSKARRSLSDRWRYVIVHIGLQKFLSLALRRSSEALEEIGELWIHEGIHRARHILMEVMRGRDWNDTLMYGFTVVLMLLGVHRDFLCALDIVLWLVIKETNVRSLILKLLFDDFQEIVFGTPQLPTRWPHCIIYALSSDCFAHVT